MVCSVCFGAAPNCTGVADSCPWIVDVASNSAALFGGSASAIKIASVLPDYILRFFPPAAVKALVALASRPTIETPFDFSSDPSLKEIVAGVANNYPPKEEALQYIQELIGDLDPADSTSSFRLDQYRATIENIRAIVPKAVSGVTRTEGVHCYILYRCSMGLCGRGSTTEASFEFCDVHDDDASGGGVKSSGKTFTASLKRPITEAQSGSLLNAFVCACTAFGLFNVLAFTPFLEESYYKKIRTQVSWHVAFELTVLYIKKVDLEPTLYNFSDVIRKLGCGDSYLSEATELALKFYPDRDVRSPCFRDRGRKPQGDGDDVYTGEIKGYDSSSKLGCYAHTHGTPHLVKHVDKATGKCKFNHDIAFEKKKGK